MDENSERGEGGVEAREQMDGGLILRARDNAEAIADGGRIARRASGGKRLAGGATISQRAL